MFKSLDMFKFLQQSFVKDQRVYKFKRFAGIFIILEPKDGLMEGNHSNGQIWERFKNLVRKESGWNIQLDKHPYSLSLFDYFQQCLKQAQNCLKRSFKTGDLYKRLDYVPDYKRLINQDLEEKLKKNDLSGSTARETRNHFKKQHEELLDWVEYDLAVLNGLDDQTNTPIIAKINENDPFVGVGIDHSSYKKIPGFNNNDNPGEFSKQLEKSYQRNQWLIRKDKEANVLPFLKLEIENYIKMKNSLVNQSGNSHGILFDLDIKLLKWPGKKHQQGMVSQLIQNKPKLILFEEAKTIKSFIAVENSKSHEYILCQLVFSKEFYKEGGFIKIKNRQSRYLMELLGPIRFALWDFIKKNPIDNWHEAMGLDWEHDQLNKLLNNLGAYIAKLSERHVPVPALLNRLIQMGWKKETLDKLFNVTFDYYERILDRQARLDIINEELKQINHIIGLLKPMIQFKSKQLDEITDNLKRLVEKAESKYPGEADDMIITVFTILQQFTWHLPAVISAYKKLNQLRWEKEPISGSHFRDIGFQLFKERSWLNGKYNFLNLEMRIRIKDLCKVYLTRKIVTLDDLTRIKDQYNILGSKEINIKLNDLEKDNILKAIIGFTDEQKSFAGSIEKCQETMSHISASKKKDDCYFELCTIKHSNGLFSGNCHRIAFLKVYLNQYWNKKELKFNNEEILDIFFEANVSLLDEDDGKEKIRFNLEILEKTTVGDQENFKENFLKVVYEKSSYYKITEDTLDKIKHENISNIILHAVQELKDRKYSNENQLQRDLNVYIDRKYNELKKTKEKENELKRQINSIKKHALMFIKDPEKLNKYLEILVALYRDKKNNQDMRISVFDIFCRIRMGQANVLNGDFLQVAFNIFAYPHWENQKIPAELDNEIRDVFFATFQDANMNNYDVKENLNLLTQELNLTLTMEEKKRLDILWREKIKTMVDREI